MPRATSRLVRDELLAWYAAHRRSLPFRHVPSKPSDRPDPYVVWVSEIMLQQTRVETAGPYFERWMAGFPDLATLAAASIEEVLARWQGLGYYGRARNLHKAARLVVDTMEGRIPGGFEGLRELPGVGEYTAGAIASIAFGEAVPAVDGNVRRVLARLDSLEGDPTRGTTKQAIQERAVELVSGGTSPSRVEPTSAPIEQEPHTPTHGSRPSSTRPRFLPGDLNQALMELGATVCKPRNPDCPRCPLARHCLARASGRQNELPTPGRKTAQREERWLAFALSDDAGRWLVARRPDSGLLGGLWEFPMVPEVAGEAPAATLAATFGISVLVVDETEDPVLPELQATSSVGHVFTHLRITALPQIGRLREARLPAADDRYQDYRWVAPSALDGDGLPTSTLMDKLVAAVRGAGPQFIR